MGISPVYRDFVVKLLSYSQLKLSLDTHAYLTHGKSNENKGKLTKKVDNKLSVNPSRIKDVYHELGHVVDYMFGYDNQLSKTVLIKDNKSLGDIFKEEFEEKKDFLLKLVMDEYRSIITSTISKEYADAFFLNIGEYQNLLRIDDNDIRKAQHASLYENGFVEAFYQIVTKKCPDILNRKYEAILDALSSYKDFLGYGLTHHERIYFTFDSNIVVAEFFANLFDMKITDNKVREEQLRLLMPKSLEAFELLFAHIYNHVTSNKKFTDMQLKEVL